MLLVFVYGSLKWGKRLHLYLKEATFLDEVITCEKFTMILSKSKWYPYLLKDKRVRIKGELYKIDFKTLKKLDRLEEVPFYPNSAKKTSSIIFDLEEDEFAICVSKLSISAWQIFK